MQTPIHRVVVAVTIFIALALGTVARQEISTAQSHAQAPQRGPDDAQPASNFAESIQGTITIVISTRQGFVLAADSRATHSYTDAQGVKHTFMTDDAQKLFQIGDKTACVIAGLSGLEIPGKDEYRAFRVRDAMASRLTLMDQVARKRKISPNAKDVALYFGQNFPGLAGLAEWFPPTSDRNAGAINAVSYDSSGKYQWFSFAIPVVTAPSIAMRNFVETGDPIIFRSLTDAPLKFDKLPLGQPQVADQLLNADRPGNDQFSRSSIMRKYYRLKRLRALDTLSLQEAVSLADTLVAATEKLSPEERGVGGPIDIATVTPQGVKWIRKKTNVAPIPAPFQIRFEGGNLPKQLFGMYIDGVQCIDCAIPDQSLFFYKGDADLELIDPIFEGRCSVILEEGAKNKQPQVVRRLISALNKRCTFSGDLPDPFLAAPPTSDPQ